MYVPAEPVYVYAPSVKADGSVLIDGDLFKALASVANLQLARDLGYYLA